MTFTVWQCVHDKEDYEKWRAEAVEKGVIPGSKEGVGSRLVWLATKSVERTCDCLRKEKHED